METFSKGTNEEPPPDLAEAFRAVQEAYWRANPAERAALEEKSIESLAWPDVLRLHHLRCIEMIESEEGQKQFLADEIDDPSPETPLTKSLEQSFARLVSAESPYRPRPLAIWHNSGPAGEQRNPEAVGMLWNASLTHLGTIEVIYAEGMTPISVGFISFEELRSVAFSNLALFRASRIAFDDEREPIIAALPLLYGWSWRSGRAEDRDGSFTRFFCHINVGGPVGTMGIGVGHQNVLMHAGQSMSLIGLGSFQEIQTVLDLSDPLFERRCRARGMDPAAIRKQQGKG